MSKTLEFLWGKWHHIHHRTSREGHTVGCQWMLEPTWSTLESSEALQASGHGLASVSSLPSCITGKRHLLLLSPSFPYKKMAITLTLKSVESLTWFLAHSGCLINTFIPLIFILDWGLEVPSKVFMLNGRGIAQDKECDYKLFMLDHWPGERSRSKYQHVYFLSSLPLIRDTHSFVATRSVQSYLSYLEWFALTYPECACSLLTLKIRNAILITILLKIVSYWFQVHSALFK